MVFIITKGTIGIDIEVKVGQGIDLVKNIKFT